MFSSAPPRLFDGVLRFAKQWLRDADAKSSIRCAVAQVIGVAAESRPLALTPHLRIFFLLLGNVLQTACEYVELGQAPRRAGEHPIQVLHYGAYSSNVLLKWDVAFHALVAVEKLLYCVPMAAEDESIFVNNVFDLLSGGDSCYITSQQNGCEARPPPRGIFMATSRLLLYRNGRVRLAASRVLGQFFARIKVEMLSNLRPQEVPRT